MNELQRNDPCWCGSGKKYKKCHYAFDERLKSCMSYRVYWFPLMKF